MSLLLLLLLLLLLPPLSQIVLVVVYFYMSSSVCLSGGASQVHALVLRCDLRSTFRLRGAIRCLGPPRRLAKSLWSL
jgi:hypothetical protein